MLEVVTSRLLQINVSIDFDCDDDEEDNIDDELSLIPSPTTSPIPMPTFNGIFSGSPFDWIGNAYSISDDLVIIGLFREGDYAADNTGAAYLFNLDGSNVKGFTPVDGDINDQYGNSVSIDEKIVVDTGPYGVQYVEVFSREGIYERKLTCDDCSEFGTSVATLGYTIVMNGEQDLVSKIFIYTIEGELLNELEQGSDKIDDVAITDEVIVSTASSGKTILYSNSSPNFPKTREIDQGGKKVSVVQHGSTELTAHLSKLFTDRIARVNRTSVQV